MKNGAMALAACCMLTGALRCEASHIKLDARPAVNTVGDTTRISVQLANSGDEPAYMVQVEAALNDRVYHGERRDSIRPAGEWTASIDLAGAPACPGTYTIALKIRYHDASGRAFSRVSPFPLIVWEPSEDTPPLTATLTGGALDGKTELELEIRRDGSDSVSNPLETRIRLALPDELYCPQPVRAIELAPGECSILNFEVRNAAALQNSVYGIFAVLDYRAGARHESLTAPAQVGIAGRPYAPAWRGWVCPALFVLFTACCVAAQFAAVRRVFDAGARRRVAVIFRAAFPALVLAAIVLLISRHIRPQYLFINTTATGGDTPAHNYLAGHLKEQLFGHGRVVSWAGGWWCGFPMFQYYFCLPYLVMALLSFVAPFNIAFKLVSVSGIYLLPFAAFLSGRIMRMPRPVPCLMAVFTLPVLFDTSHTMWGVNMYSTLAGMIANSLSFPIMLIFLACVHRDAEDGIFRFRTAFLFAALMASHFFTSLIAGICAALPAIAGARHGFRKTAGIIAAECALGAAFMAWWLVPLAARMGYSTAFGYNWDATLAEHVRRHFAGWPTLILLVCAGIAPVAYLARRGRKACVPILCGMLIVAVLLHKFGYDISSVFVNVRFWPFIVYSVSALAAVGLGMPLSRTRGGEFGAAAIFAAAISLGTGASNDSAIWSKWNYTGIERKYDYPVLEQLVLPLDGTRGRLANDLHPGNNRLGSSRIFECVPQLIDKPILEGGIVNSAMGSMFAYYVQSETSDTCAGFPNVMIPATFDMTNATAHLELFNVRHFIARSPRTRAAMADMPDRWRPVRSAHEWELFESATNDGGYVFVPNRHPVPVTARFGTRGWKETALSWLYTIEALDYPFAFVEHSRAGGDSPFGGQRSLSRDEYRHFLAGLKSGGTDIRTWLLLGPFPCDPDTQGNGIPHDVSSEPAPGKRVAGRQWRYAPLFPTVRPDRFYRRNCGIVHYTNMVSYGFANIFSRTDRNALIHFSADDNLVILLNGERAAETGMTGFNVFRTVPVRLRPGRNRLLVRSAQLTGANYFHLRVTDPSGGPLPDAVVCTADTPPALPADLWRTIDRARVRISNEKLTDNAIRFTTATPGLPHIIKCMYHPNWKMRDGGAVRMVTPGFMLVYPKSSEVELYYGRTLPDNLGLACSCGALLGAAAYMTKRRKRRKPRDRTGDKRA